MILTNEQRAAVSEEGNVYLTACPGSGKTRVIISKLVSCLEEVRETPRSIACITYTNSAVYEIEERLKEITRSDDNRYYQVCTIHSFCLNNIFRPYHWRAKGYEKGFKILTREMPEFEEIVNSVASEFGLLRLRFNDYESFSMINIDAQGNPIGAALEEGIVTEPMARRYWEKLQEEGYIDFSNIIYQSFKLISDYPEILNALAAKFSWILVDEFQDTTDLQVEVLKKIYDCGRTKFFLVGDAFQAVYGFTGAKPELAEHFAAHINAKTELILSGNFRSSPKIIEHAERIFARNPAMTALGPLKKYNESPQYHHVTHPFAAITDYFLPELDRLEIPYGEAAILAPWWSNFFQLAPLLREYGIGVIGPGARPYRRSHIFANITEHLCGHIANPEATDVSNIERVLFRTIQDTTGKLYYNIFSYSGRILTLEIIKTAKKYGGPEDSASIWLDEVSQELARLLVESDILTEAEKDIFYVSAQEMKADIRNRGIDLDNLTIEEIGFLAKPQNSIRLSTLHFSKGREYSAVALIDIHEGKIPHFSISESDAERLEEAKRLFYVGVTRAKKFLMYVTDMRDSRDRPTRFLGPDGVNLIQ